MLNPAIRAEGAMKTIPWAVIVGTVLTACQGIPAAGRASPTPTHCFPLSFPLEISIFPDRLVFYEGETFSIAVDHENRYGGVAINLIQEGLETPVSLQGGEIISPGRWGKVEVLPKSGNKQFDLRALSAGTIVLHAEVNAEMPGFDNNCVPMPSMTNIRSDPLTIVINPYPGGGGLPTSESTSTELITDTWTPAFIAQPSGKYACEGHEYGLIASIGSVTFFDDGSFLDQAFATPQTGVSGQWQMFPAVHQIRFSENIDFDYAEYLPNEDAVTMFLRPGITRAHAEGGTIRCFKAGA
jgi:hypothetical protein